MSPGLKEIADACGLARSTVGNILCSKGAYAEGTRQRVLEIARKLGYQPSRLARSLSERSSPAVGLLGSHLTDPYIAELLDGLTRELSSRGLEVMVSLASWQSADDVLKSYRAFLSWRVRGLVAFGDPSLERIDCEDLRREAQSMAFMTLNFNPWPECSAVFPDRWEMARRAAVHLAELGHRRIGILSYSQAPGHFKAEALRKALGERDLHLRPQDIYYCPLAETAAFDLGRRFAHMTDRPTAMVAWNESTASRFIAAFMVEGGHVPNDLSVVTYNNSLRAEIGALPLTAVGVPVRTFISTAMAVLGEALAAGNGGQRHVRQVKMALELVMRFSSGPAPGTV